MNHTELKELLDSLIATWENEVVEFKQVGKDYKTSDIGQYVSALANEANLRAVETAWLVFGVDNKTKQLAGTDYRKKAEDLQNLKYELSQGSNSKFTIRNAYALDTPQGRVVMLEIPAAPRGIAIGWNGFYYGRVNESLAALSMDKLDEIRGQTLNTDWTAQVVQSATLDDLDEAAVAQARKSFAKKNAKRFSAGEVDQWSLATFLAQAELTQQGKITRATLLLLGKPSAGVYLLSPMLAQLTWSLEGAERAYEHFGTPFLLSTTALYQKIRNTQVRILPANSLLAVEVPKYDARIVLEALHNCIAHQDYRRSSRVVVTETIDRLVFESAGEFFEGTPQDYVTERKRPKKYRNPALVQAMAALNMIDSMGYGIYDMQREQAKRYFPMNDYDPFVTDEVRLTVYGNVVDIAYSRVLMEQTSLPLTDILALDRVQKKLPIDDVSMKHLRKAGLVEGRKPNLHIASIAAKTPETRVDYILTRAQDDVFYKKQITDFLREHGSASRDEIDLLLLKKISDGLTETQKVKKIANLLTGMRGSGDIKNIGSKKDSQWVLC
jgi:ATP-dependent DNA helicase RecG